MNTKSIYEPYYQGDDAVPSVAYLLRPPEHLEPGSPASRRPWLSLNKQRQLITNKAMADQSVIIAEFVDDGLRAYFEDPSEVRGEMEQFEQRHDIVREYRVVLSDGEPVVLWHQLQYDDDPALDHEE